jgi:uncharacterized membrane protein YphA (DoxX/SURF4 family)
MKAKLITYWITTALIAFMLLSGGVMYFMHPPEVSEGMAKLGYPGYLLYILGVWKILGAAAILAPGFPRLKEWAYAGIFFDLTGAAASHAFSQDYGPGAFHLLVPLALTGVMFISWALRPAGRTVAA